MCVYMHTYTTLYKWVTSPLALRHSALALHAVATGPGHLGRSPTPSNLLTGPRVWSHVVPAMLSHSFSVTFGVAFELEHFLLFCRHPWACDFVHPLWRDSIFPGCWPSKRNYRHLFFDVRSGPPVFDVFQQKKGALWLPKPLTRLPEDFLPSTRHLAGAAILKS